MPIFGQVWLWSLLAFLLGAVLCWLLVARPARSRVGELEAQLATRARRQAIPERPEPSRRRDDEADFAGSMSPGLGERRGNEDAEYLTRSYALRETPPLPPERDRLAPYADPPAHDYAPLAPESDAFAFDSPPSEQQYEFDAPQQDSFAFDSPRQDAAAFDSPRQESAAFNGPGSESFGYDSRSVESDGSPSSAATQYLDVSSGALSAPPEVPQMSPPPDDRGWFGDEIEGDEANQGPEEQAAVPRNRHHMIAPFVDDDDHDHTEDHDEDAYVISDALDGDEHYDDSRSAIEDDDNTGTVFTQRTHPIPGELIRQIDEAGQEEHEQRDAFVDDLADDPAEPEVDRRERTVESEPVERPAFAADDDTADDDLLVASEPELMPPPEEPAERTEVVAAVREKPSNDLPRRVPMQSKMPGVAVRVDPTPNALPKRVPGKPRHQVPFGVQPDATPEPSPVAAIADEAPSSPRSLFEPIVPAEDEGGGTPPPPHRLRQASSGGRGPFGPGSAMPLTGGASPSPEFTIKASVAALRYCTPESPQFGRTVAEVWFRTAADAERVGFRPVG